MNFIKTNMVVTYHIEGTIELDLNKYDIQGLNGQKSESLKKAFLEEVLKKKLEGCALAGENELDINIDFSNVQVAKDWSKYPGSIVDLDKNDPVGSPLGIYIEDNIPTTYDEATTMAMIEIGRRKKNKKR